jgi:hypothetical protein
VIDERDVFEAPIDCICTSINASSLFCTRRPRGRRWKTPEWACYVMSELII